MLDMKRSEDWLKRSCWIWCGSLCGSALVRRRNNDIRICDGIKTPDASLRLAFLVAFLFSSTSTVFGQFNDKSVDLAALPKVPDEFTVTLFASEPMVRQPCSMAFDERGRDGDDEADEYVRVYTDLGNLEHGLHGLNWAPDGKLYMTKGNSKGLNQLGRYAPKPFRESLKGTFYFKCGGDR